MTKRALIVYGGWEGHHPPEIAGILSGELRAEGFEVTARETLDAFRDLSLGEFDLIVLHWTMGTINQDQLRPLLDAVQSGVGLAGLHGGLCDAFRNETEYQFMTGGQFVAHPGGNIPYTVRMDGLPSPITEGIADFDVTTELYYLHVDPGNTVLATSRAGSVIMPVVWTKMWGKGRVFYCSLGHSPDIVRLPPVLTLMRRGMAWAAR